MPTSTSSEEEIETFYEELEKAMSECTSQDPLIIMGDFNAKVGQHGNDKAVGKHGLGIRNERGEQLVTWCDEHDLIIGNTCFEQQARRKWTWKQPGDNARNQIDFILVKERFRNALLSAKSYPGADCYSDHIPVTAKFRLKLKNVKRRPRNIKLNLALLKSDLSLRQRYSINVRNKFQLLGQLEEPEEQWHQLKTAITEAATEEIPPT
ncbi:craniofacial development protein 2-like [Elysia marginata]|uniref:Craniofacial development protein 2-like n=1 Tax=Elysia marginata TaxID=1093978 RepID=A0AAV4IC15_9GAST|nr:craniofacial development protein 2-like [Elysia marginata]